MRPCNNPRCNRAILAGGPPMHQRLLSFMSSWPWVKLSPELLAHVASFLPASYALRLQAACVAWRRAVDSASECWAKWSLQRFGYEGARDPSRQAFVSRSKLVRADAVAMLGHGTDRTHRFVPERCRFRIRRLYFQGTCAPASQMRYPCLPNRATEPQVQLHARTCRPLFDHDRGCARTCVRVNACVRASAPTHGRTDWAE